MTFSHDWSKVKWVNDYLTLPEGNGGEFLRESHLLGELVEIGGRICTLGEYEDEGSGRRRILEHQVKIGGL